MKLTPLDIRKHEFARRFRGYDPEEVRPFLEMLSQQWDELQEELRHTRDRVRELEGKISHYEKIEEALQQALESARDTAQRTQVHAEERAKLIVEQAELRAEQILSDTEQDRFRLRQDVSKLTHRHAEVTARLRHFLMSELEILAQHEDERPIGFMKLIPAREAETLPEPPEATPKSEPDRSAEAAAEPAAERHVPREEEPSPEQEQPSRDEPVVPHERSAAAAESWSQESDDDRSATTYADLYARAVRRSHEDEPYDELGELGPLDAADEEEEEPTWNLRQIVGEEEDEREREEVEPGRTERDQIRRIIEDLD